MKKLISLSLVIIMLSTVCILTGCSKIGQSTPEAINFSNINVYVDNFPINLGKTTLKELMRSENFEIEEDPNDWYSNNSLSYDENSGVVDVNNVRTDIQRLNTETVCLTKDNQNVLSVKIAGLDLNNYLDWQIVGLWDFYGSSQNLVKINDYTMHSSEGVTYSQVLESFGFTPGKPDKIDTQGIKSLDYEKDSAKVSVWGNENGNKTYVKLEELNSFWCVEIYFPNHNTCIKIGATDYSNTKSYNGINTLEIDTID